MFDTQIQGRPQPGAVVTPARISGKKKKKKKKKEKEEQKKRERENARDRF